MKRFVECERNDYFGGKRRHHYLRDGSIPDRCAGVGSAKISLTDPGRIQSNADALETGW